MSERKLIDRLSKSEYQSIKDSFFHIYHSFLDEGFLSKDFVGCLFKWGIQLRIEEGELKQIDTDYERVNIQNKGVAIEHLFNLVYMIYLDGKVEDIELLVVSKYAEKLGFEPHIVNDLLKTIVTAPDDGCELTEVKLQIKEIVRELIKN